jgi:hypothetical protein
MNHGYLAKKSWHPLTIRNAEKVWLAEQRHTNEMKKMLELQKKLDDERKMMELHSLKDATGKYQKKEERVDFLYRGAPEVTSDQYLEGKSYDFEKEEKDLITQGQTQLGLLTQKSESEVHDMWAKVREDPLTDILKKRQEQIEKLKDNPIKIERLKRQLQEEMKQKNPHKHKHKHKHSEKVKEKKDKHKHERKDKEKKKREKSHKISNGSHKDRQESHKSHTNDERISQKRSHSHLDGDKKEEEKEEEYRKKRKLDEKPLSSSVSSSSSSSSTTNPTTSSTTSKWAPIGTRPDLQEEEEELRKNAQRLQLRKDRATEMLRGISRENREELLQQMANDATAHRDKELRRLEREKKEDEEENSTSTTRDLNERPHFLNETTRAAYLENTEQLSDTLHRRRHYRHRESH